MITNEEYGFVVYDEAGAILRKGSCRPSLVTAQGDRVLVVHPSELERIDDRLHRVKGGRVVEVSYPEDAEIAAAEAQAVRDGRGAMRVHRAAVRKTLLERGLLESVDAAVAEASPETRIAWNDVVRFDRLNPDVRLWAPFAGLNDDEALDAFFRRAVAIETGDI